MAARPAAAGQPADPAADRLLGSPALAFVVNALTFGFSAVCIPAIGGAAVIHWPVLAIIVVAFCGVGGLLVEITMETCLQRTLDPEVFGRAYGLAIPASLGGIAAGSLIGPLLSGALGISGALAVIGGAVLCYAALLLRGQRTAQVPVPQAVAAVE